MAKSPAAILYNESGNPVGVMLDGAMYRLQTQSAMTQLVLPSSSNDTTTPLGAYEVFTGGGESTLGVAGIQVNVFTDQPSQPEGLIVQQSMDNVNWDIEDKFTVERQVGVGITVQATARYFRIVYRNGGAAQDVFRLQVALCPVVEAVPRSLGAKESDKSLSVVLAKDQAPVVTEEKRGLEQENLFAVMLSELQRIRVLLEILTDEQVGESDVETRG